MRKVFLAILVLFFLSSTATAASIIDRETKQGVLGLEQRFDQFIQIELSRHAEQMKLLQEQRDILQKILQNTQAASAPMTKAPLPLQAPSVAAGVVQPVIPQPLSVIPLMPTSPSQSSAQAQSPTQTAGAVSPQQATVLARSVETPIVVTKPSPKPVFSESTRSASATPNGFLSFLILVSLAVIASLVTLILRMKRNEERARKMVWKSEVETLRGDFVQGRPIVKILVVGDRMELTNTGETSADDIRLMVGTGPSSMKQKVKTTNRIRASERISFDLPLHISNGPLYASLEYRNPNNGRTYKDTFVLTADRMTGGLTPAREAS